MPPITVPKSIIKKVGILGEGKMGTAIFNYLLDYDLELVWACSKEADIDKIARQLTKRIKRSFDAGNIDRQRFDHLLQTPVTRNQGELHACDLVIEAVPEILELKKNLFEQLDKIVNPAAIFTSNSSSINPSEMAPRGLRAEKFAGLHFFYPVPLKNIVELTVSPETGNQTRHELELFLDTINRRSISLEEKNSFILNRLFLDFQNEAFLIVQAGNCSFEQMDQLVKKQLFPFGVFDFCDQVGIDTMLASVLNYTHGYPHKGYFSPFISSLQTLASEGKFGIKSMEGFYTYPIVEIEAKVPSGSDGIVEHLRQTWLSSSKRFTAQTHLPIDDMNWAIKEYFGTDKGPFE
jgi:3-hydroxybutyryl-CoA dehydrogenase